MSLTFFNVRREEAAAEEKAKAENAKAEREKTAAEVEPKPKLRRNRQK